jgi:hypothetical protein
VQLQDDISLERDNRQFLVHRGFGV